MNLHAELEKLNAGKPLTSGDVMGAVVKRSAIFPLTSLPAFFALGATVLSSLFGGVEFLTTSALWMGAAAATSFLYNVTARRKKHVERAYFKHSKQAGLKQQRGQLVKGCTLQRLEEKKVHRAVGAGIR